MQNSLENETGELSLKVNKILSDVEKKFGKPKAGYKEGFVDLGSMQKQSPKELERAFGEQLQHFDKDPSPERLENIHAVGAELKRIGVF